MFGTTAQARCRFGDAVTTAIFKNSYVIVCVLPPSSIRQVDKHPTLFPTRFETVAASIDGGVSWTRYDPNATVQIERYDASAHKVVPHSGPIRGGFPLRVHGYGMRAVPMNDTEGGDAMCVFGADIRPAVKRSDTWIECIVPPAFSQLPSGRLELQVNVRVSLRHTDYLLEADTGQNPRGTPVNLTFQYYGEPAVRTIAPWSGPSVGGTSLTITGDFPNGLRNEDVLCKFTDADEDFISGLHLGADRSMRTMCQMVQTDYSRMWSNAMLRHTCRQ